MPTILDIFPSKIRVGDPARFVPRTRCWRWLGTIKGDYGSVTYQGRSWGAHQLSLFLKIGKRSDNSFYACHTCDNTWCVNPDHLFLGTHIENQLDRIKWKTQITLQDLRDIKDSDQPSWFLAKKYQLSMNQIEFIRPMRLYAERAKYKGKIINRGRGIQAV